MVNKIQFVNTLSESRLFRTKQIAAKVNIDDASDLAFCHFLVLNVMNKDYDFAPLAGNYADKTMQFRNFDYFRTNGTDLYMALNRLMGKDVDNSDDKDEIASKRIAINKADVLRYLLHIGGNKSDSGFEQRYLLRFQRDLNVQDGMLKSIRRLVGDWDNLNQNQKALVVTRLVQWFRAKARRSELLPALERLQKRGNYSVNDSKDKKKKMWDNPIAQAAGVIGAIGGARALGKRLGTTSYRNKRELGNKYR